MTSNPNENKSTASFHFDDKTPFKSVYGVEIISVKEFGHIVSNYMKKIFVDWEGCTVQSVASRSNDGGNISAGLMLCFWFNHMTHPDDGRVVALSNSVNDNNKGETLSTMRRMVNTINNGDGYRLTEDAQEMLTPYMLSSAFGRNSKINWGNYVTEVAPRQNMFNTAPTVQYTMVYGLDIDKFIPEIFGDKDENGSPARYMYWPIVTPKSTINIDTWFLGIARMGLDEFSKITNYLGVGDLFRNDLSILR